jgi:hypothetical protein
MRRRNRPRGWPLRLLTLAVAAAFWVAGTSAQAATIGPGYDPEQPLASYLSGGSLAQWFDLIVHCQVVTAWQPL